jgi:hypothetical protein
MRAADASVLARLESDDLVWRSRQREDEEYRTTRRWQAAMARAAFRLYASGDEASDLRLPIAFALVEIYGSDVPDADLALYVEHMLPIEAHELDPRERLARAREASGV